MEKLGHTPAAKVVILTSGLCALLFVIRIIYTRSLDYWFLMDNLLLALLPLGISYLLVWSVHRSGWSALQNLILALVWLLFLPNAWYVLTDYVHVGPMGQPNQLYLLVLVTSLVLAGFSAGFYSLFMIHKALLRRFSKKISWVSVCSVLILSSFAIYVGRDLRWSSWDIATHPDGLALDLSDRLIHPLGYPTSWDVTGGVFLLLLAIYMSLWFLVSELDRLPKDKA